MDDHSTDCLRSDRIDCRFYRICLDQAAKLNLNRVCNQHCSVYRMNPGYDREIREGNYFSREMNDFEYSTGHIKSTFPE